MLKLGTNNIDSIYLGSTEIEKAYLGNDLVYQKGESAVDYSTRYLTFTALESTTISLRANNSTPNITSIYYSVDDGSTWSSFTLSTTSTNVATLATGASLLLKGTQTAAAEAGRIFIEATGNFDISGNSMSLIYGDNFIGQDSLVGKDFVFYGMFYQNTHVVNAKDLVLPALTLSQGCYQYMFYGCSSLVSAPELPATTLATGCYYSMFSGCTALTTAQSILPATTLVEKCYYQMFRDCTSLTTAPELPATTLVSNCYNQMFSGCTSLATAPVLPATTLAQYCYVSMFNRCTSLTTAPELPATALAKYCYSSMFQGCTSLTTAPELPATTLVNNCYGNMFYGCSQLNYIKAMFTTTPSTSYTRTWVQNVAATGTFVKNRAATWNVTGNSGIPSGWGIQTARS